ERTAAMLRTGELQMRPVLMTCVIAGVGLLPAAISTGIGSQVQKPLAVVVVGGMMLAPAVILITLPVLILLFSRRAARPAPQQAVPAPAEGRHGVGKAPTRRAPGLFDRPRPVAFVSKTRRSAPAK